ncbi:transcriptional regulator, TetR family [Sphingopyxis sp. YR583]|uniref:TetR/AcrR family transcriptional regulator n=1 Tax=Sphingopyxis sp. YR583 TaxID=1881047 RepID=UPI0008A73D99|nr:TetR/AcrR family transcriptional regulator [Sphingopyxis sp. YR583]SEH13919.1 transcriptional regulator, TetR family [Sphingopyxis sp. YR583]
MKNSQIADPKRMGRPPKITRDEILDAAYGSDPNGLQLASLADRLGVSVKTIYYYFPGRQSLVDAITERAIAETNPPEYSGCGTWQEVVRQTALWYSHLGTSQPGWMNDPAAPIGIKKVGLNVLRLACRKLAQFGWGTHDAYRAHVLVSNWAIAQGESARAADGDYRSEDIERTLEDYGEESFITELSDIMGPLKLASDVFEDGLQILIAGIEATIVRAAR